MVAGTFWLSTWASLGAEMRTVTVLLSAVQVPSLTRTQYVVVLCGVGVIVHSPTPDAYSVPGGGPEYHVYSASDGKTCVPEIEEESGAPCPRVMVRSPYAVAASPQPLTTAACDCTLNGMPEQSAPT